MADKQPLHATFFAFRKRERSGVLLRASIAFVIIALVLIGAFVGVFWSSLAQLIAWYGDVIAAAARNDTAAMQAAGFPMQFFSVIGALLLWLFPFYILCAAYEAACLRWMIHGATDGFMGLSLGAPTWRVWGCYWMWMLLNMAFSTVMSIIMMSIMGVLAVSSGGDPTAMQTALPVFYLLQYVLMIYFAVRFAPASATTIARRRFSFFDAWTVTKGRFWSLLGSFAILWVVYMLAGLVLAIAWFVWVLGSSAPDLSAIPTDPQGFNTFAVGIIQAYLQSLTQPQSWIVIGAIQIVGFFFAALFYIAMYGVNARAAMVAMEEGKIKPAEG